MLKLKGLHQPASRIEKQYGERRPIPLAKPFLRYVSIHTHKWSSGNSGTITFRSRVENNFTIGTTRHRLVIAAQVVDTGSGIDADMLEQIFYPMVTGREGGTGLGLSIAQQTINQLGGLIECSSKPGDTIFTVYIPMEHT